MKARAQAAAAPANLFEIRKVADGVYAAIARPSVLTNCNGVIFENAGDLLIVDSHAMPSAAAALVAQVRKEVSTKPVRYIVNTHFHGDHVQGNAALVKAFPHSVIVSSAETRKILAERGAQSAKGWFDQIPKIIEENERKLAAARSEQEKAFFRQAVADTKAYLAEMRDFTPELPNITFDDNMVIHDKAHDLHLAFCGRGHTAGDIVVYCPQKRALATGDLAHGFLPYIGDGYPREWPRTIDALGAFDFEHAIGGHGAPQRGRARAQQMRAYIEELTEQVERGKQQGQSVQELQKTITPARLKSIENGGYGEFVASSLNRYAAVEPAATRAQVLEDGVRENIASIYTALGRS